MKEAAVAGVDLTFKRLEEVVLYDALGELGVGLRYQVPYAEVS